MCLGGWEVGKVEVLGGEGKDPEDRRGESSLGGGRKSRGLGGRRDDSEEAL